MWNDSGSPTLVEPAHPALKAKTAYALTRKSRAIIVRSVNSFHPSRLPTASALLPGPKPRPRSADCKSHNDLDPGTFQQFAIAPGVYNLSYLILFNPKICVCM